MAQRKGHPRCEACGGRGIVHGPRGYVVCQCVRGKPNRAMLARLAAIELPDFIEWDDEQRRLRGLPPYDPEVTHDQ